MPNLTTNLTKFLLITKLKMIHSSTKQTQTVVLLSVLSSYTMSSDTQPSHSIPPSDLEHINNYFKTTLWCIKKQPTLATVTDAFSYAI